MAAAHLRERGKFGLAVCRAKLSRLRNVYHAGLDDVLFNRAGGVVLFDEVLHLLRVELAVGSGQGEHFVAGGFDGAGFVGGDVAGFGSDNALVRPQDMGDYSGIGLRAAHQKMHISCLAANGRADFGAGRLAVGIKAVARGLLKIAVNHALKNGRMAAGEIVVAKREHGRAFLQKAGII